MIPSVIQSARPAATTITNAELQQRVQVLESTVQFLQQQLMLTQNSVQELTQQVKSLSSSHSSLAGAPTPAVAPVSIPIPIRSSATSTTSRADEDMPPLESASNLLNSSTPAVSSTTITNATVKPVKKKRPAASPALASVVPKAAPPKLTIPTPSAFGIPSLFDDMDDDETSISAFPMTRPVLRAQNSASSTTSTKGSRTNTPILTAAANPAAPVPSFPSALTAAATPLVSTSGSAHTNTSNETLTEEKSQSAGNKRKRVPDPSPNAASSSATASTIAASSSEAIVPPLTATITSIPGPVSTVSVSASQQSSPPPPSAQPHQPPEAGRYDDPSLIDVADYNRDLDAMDSDELLASGPQSYRMMVALEKELRLVEEEYETRRLAPLQPPKRPRLGNDAAIGSSTTTTTSSNSSLSRSIESALASERECVQFSEVYEMRLDPSSGRTIVLAGPPIGDAGDSYTRSSAQWIMPTQLDVFSAPNYLPPRSVYRRLKLHQLQAVNFILGNLLGRFNPENEPTGCILADALGLGKSLSTLAALQCYAQITMDQKQQLAKQMGKTPSSVQAPCFLLVCPPTVLKHWLNEVNKLTHWLSENEFESTGNGTSPATRKWLSPAFVLDSTVPIDEREAILKTWKEQRGILFVGYDMLREIITSAHTISVSSTAAATTSSSPGPSAAPAPMIIDEGGDVESEDEDVMDLTGDDTALAAITSSSAGAGSLISYFQSSPPDALVLDEGHRIRNLYSGLHQTLARAIPTRARVILSGYPLQNALSELYAMIDFVRPPHLSQGHSLGSHRDFQKFFEIPILKAQSSDNIMVRRKARRRCWMLFDLMSRLHLMLRRSNTLLVNQLHIPLYEIVLVLRFSKEQIRIYNEILRDAKQSGKEVWRILDLVSFVSMLLSHPQILKQHVLESAAEISNSQSVDDHARSSMQLKKAFIERVLPSSSPFDLLSHHSPKMFLLLQLILKCKEAGDKVLVFSKWISTLNFIESLFQSHNRVIDSLLLTHQDQIMRAGERIRYGRFDGTTPQSERQKWIKQFGPLQDGDSATTSSQEVIPDVLLISLGCGEGINLCRANRVILLDVSWNPNSDLQASHRIFRFGQTKPCFIYRFIIGHSMEEKVFLKQIKKEELSKWSIERKNVVRNVGLTAPASEAGPPVGASPPASSSAITSSGAQGAKSAKEDDPTNIKRFFDPPPSISDMLKQPASIQLNSSIVNDPVTKQILDQFSSSGRSKATADISTGEPNGWILSAFEQHSLMDEDDASTVGIFGERPEPITVVRTPAPAPLVTVRSPHLSANQMNKDIIVPIPASAASLASVPTSNSMLTSNTTGAISSASTGTTSVPAHPPSNPVYWFGAVPAGVTLARSSSSSGSASATSKAVSSQSNSNVASATSSSSQNSTSASSLSSLPPSSSSASSYIASKIVAIRPSTPPSTSVPIPRLSPQSAAASSSSSSSTSVISSAVRSGPTVSSASMSSSAGALISSSNLSSSRKETEKTTPVGASSSSSSSSIAPSIGANASRTPDAASFPVLSVQLSHSREKLAQLSDSRKARRLAEDQAAAEQEKARIEREAREKAQQEADRRAREQRERESWNNGRTDDSYRKHNERKQPSSHSARHRSQSKGNHRSNERHDSRSSHHHQSSSRHSPTQKQPHRSVSPAHKSHGGFNGQPQQSQHKQVTPSRPQVTPPRPQVTPPKPTPRPSTPPQPRSSPSPSNHQQRVTAVVAHPPKPANNPPAPTALAAAPPRSIAEQKLELYHQRASGQP